MIFLRLKKVFNIQFLKYNIYTFEKLDIELKYNVSIHKIKKKTCEMPDFIV